MEERIVAAARRCFHRSGWTATRMDEIAEEADLLRPNLYRYFASKDALMTEVIVREFRVAHAERRRLLPMEGPVRPLLVESMVLGFEFSGQDELVKLNMSPDAISLTARLVSTEQKILDVEYEYWGPLLEYGRARREITTLLSNERIVRWFISVHFMFLERPEFYGEVTTVRGYVEDFVISPILA